MPKSALSRQVDQLVAEVAAAARTSGRSVAVAESLTGGQLSAALASGPDASTWFRGGIVAYHAEVKHTLLRTPRGPVVTAETASDMARSTCELLGADVTVALTGVGGPGREEGKPPGTVYLATYTTGQDSFTGRFEFDGEPVEVIEQTIRSALRALLGRIRAA